MQKYWNTVQDEQGRPRYGANVAVQQSGVNSTIYSDSSGLVPKANPLTTDATRGYFEFYAAAGAYDLVVSGIGFAAYTISNGAEIGLPSGDVTFAQSGSGALTRTMQDKGRERISVADFDTLAHALTAATGKRLIAAAVPSTITASTAIPASTILDVEQGCALVFSGAGNITLGSNAGIISKSEGASADVWYWGRNYTGSKSVGASSPQNLGAGPAGFMFDLRTDDADASTDFVRALRGRTVFGGSSAKGGRIGVLGEVLHQNGITSASNGNRNYIGVAGVTHTYLGDGGTNTGAGALGAYFGASANIFAHNGATNIFELCGMEIDVNADTGTTAKYQRALSLSCGNQTRGVLIDAGLTLSSYTDAFGLGVGWNTGILFTDANGGAPTHAGSNLMSTYWTGGGTKTITNAFDLSGYVVTGAVIQTSAMSLTNDTLTMAANGANLSVILAGQGVAAATLLLRAKGGGSIYLQDGTSVTRVEVDGTGIRFTGTMSQGGTACVAAYGPAAVASITVKNGLITAIS